jgi:hypothetical protein
MAEITIPDSVEGIDTKAFCECYHLKKVVFGSLPRLKKIRGFHFCRFEEIELPESIEVMDDEAFT